MQIIYLIVASWISIEPSSLDIILYFSDNHIDISRLEFIYICSHCIRKSACHFCGFNLFIFYLYEVCSHDILVNSFNLNANTLISNFSST